MASRTEYLGNNFILVEVFTAAICDLSATFLRQTQKDLISVTVAKKV